MFTPNGLRKAAFLASVFGIGLVGRAIVRGLRRVDLRGKTVLITGGSRGLGLALARELTDKGARLSLCARDGNELERARSELTARGAEVYVECCDVTHVDQVERFVEHTVARFGGVDVLIANAATIRVGPLASMTKRDFEDAMSDIFWGALHATMAVLPTMRKQGGGRIVHISSIGGKVAVPHLGPYTTAKFALTGFSEWARAELAQEGITVTTIAPGLMRTGSHLNAEFKGQVEKEFAWFSLGATSKLTAIDASRAARRIIDAVETGDAEVVLSVPAKLLAWAHGLFPGFVTDLMALGNRLAMPASGGSDNAVRGMDVKASIPPSASGGADDALAEFYHQFPGPFGGKRAPGSA